MKKVAKILKNLKSRKVIMLVLGVIYALLTVFKEQLGISLDPEAVVTSMAVIAVYIFGEFKKDMKKSSGLLKGKWKDPKFWLSAIGSILPIASTIFGIKIPVKTITAGIAAIVAFLFKPKKE